MAGVRIDSPLLSRNIVEIFDIIESVSAELEEQRRAIGQLADKLKVQDGEIGEVRALLTSLRQSTDFCVRMFS